MNETAFDRLIAYLARGDGDGAHSYLTHFAKADRSPPAVRAGLASRLHPEVMATFERLAPWLLDDDDGRVELRVHQALDEAGAAGLSASELAFKLRRVRAKDIADVVNAMRAAGEVVVEKSMTGGRPAFIHRLAQFATKPDVALNPFA